MPIFAREGAIIPQQPSMRYVGEKNIDVLTLDIFPGKNNSFSLYEDDGESLSYQQKNFSTTNISVSNSSQALEIKIAKPEGMYKSAVHRYSVKLHTAKKPRSVQESGKSVGQLQAVDENKNGWYFDEKGAILYITTASNNNENIQLTIQN